MHSIAGKTKLIAGRRDCERRPAQGLVRLGRREYIGRGWKMSSNDLGIQAPAPLLGQDNDYLLREVLGLSDQHLNALVRDQVVGDVPEGASVPATVSLDEQVELGSIVDWDPDHESS